MADTEKQKKFDSTLAAHVDARKVTVKQMAAGESRYGTSGPGVKSLRVIKRNDQGIIVFDKNDPKRLNPFTKEGVNNDAAGRAIITDWMNGNGTIGEVPKDLRAEVEFEDSRGWINAADGKLNTELADEDDEA